MGVRQREWCGSEADVLLCPVHCAHLCSMLCPLSCLCRIATTGCLHSADLVQSTHYVQCGWSGHAGTCQNCICIKGPGNLGNMVDHWKTHQSKIPPTSSLWTRLPPTHAPPHVSPQRPPRIPLHTLTPQHLLRLSLPRAAHYACVQRDER